MSRQIKGLLYFYITDAKHSLMVFWSILFGTLVISIVGAYLLLNVAEGQMNFGLSIAAYIYCGIYGFISAKHGTPFSIKLGATRKNMFVSTGIFLMGLAIVQAVLVSTVQTVVVAGAKIVGIDTFQFIHPAQLLTDNWVTRFVIDTAMMFFLLSLLYLIGLLFYKYGLLGSGIVLGILAVILLFGVAKGWVINFFIDIATSFSITFFYEILLIGIVIYGVSWLLIRKITTTIAR
ncbi:hypothetical protein WMZ97_19300 [Lentibacillus sp. N15]|uniref:hypothetical protein n=1 Tax=Lentibacillus songyuanensis TaxID=3136161 RepID=UPI0031B9CEDA